MLTLARRVLARRATNRRATALWSLAFRPFFLAASVWSVLALALWIAMLLTGVSQPSRFDPVSWHIHAMLFGFVLAAIAGFILTAIPNWTDRVPIRGAALSRLVLLWLLGRIACFVSSFLPLWLAALADVAFPFVLCAVVAREIVAARNWRNLVMPVPIGVLGIANLLMYLAVGGSGVPAGLGWRLAIFAIIVLVSAVGGRIIPTFTRNWLVMRGSDGPPSAHGPIDRMALGTLHAGLLGWVFFPETMPIGVLLLIAAALNFWRLARWRGLATLAEPLLTVLHLGYLWIPVGAVLLGAATLTDFVPEAAAIHAFTAGAIGTMVLAVMTRVSRGHTGRPLQADRPTAMIYLTITAAAVARVAAGFAGPASLVLLAVSAVLWVTSFALFIFYYGPMLVYPRAWFGGADRRLRPSPLRPTLREDRRDRTG